MKRFRFSLEKVLYFRQRELELAESRLEQIKTQQTYLERRGQALEQESLKLREQTTRAEATTGAALASMHHYVESLGSKQDRAIETLGKLEQERREHLKVLIEKRREVEVLKRLKGKRKKAYVLASGRQESLEMADLFLGGWSGKR
jgi:flagellar export protein FliJ